jgi:hypothetical protein
VSCGIFGPKVSLGFHDPSGQQLSSVASYHDLAQQFTSYGLRVAREEPA